MDVFLRGIESSEIARCGTMIKDMEGKNNKSAIYTFMEIGSIESAYYCKKTKTGYSVSLDSRNET